VYSIQCTYTVYVYSVQCTVYVYSAQCTCTVYVYSVRARVQCMYVYVCSVRTHTVLANAINIACFGMHG